MRTWMEKVGIREWNLEGMTRPQQIELLAYEREQLIYIKQLLYGMQLKRRQRTKRYADIEQVLWYRQKDITALAEQIGGMGAQVDDLLVGYYDD